LCSSKCFSGKTMGVIALQGEAQAELIQEKLLKRIGAEEIENRRLVCGNPYSFQGDERDIIFLSMVAATNERIGPFTKPADERRFNVAASRAKDQMYLFCSVDSYALSEKCLRRKLIEFFENTRPQTIGGIERNELERRAAQDNRSMLEPPDPFDSWFEVDVALAIERKGYQVRPQYEVAGKRIDLVVEGGQARLAVECDGDAWHGPDRYEDDMMRQRQLERCGWMFFRVRESAFYSNRESALKGLWQELEERGIYPRVQRPKLGIESDTICNEPNQEVFDESDGKSQVNDGFLFPVGVLEDRNLSGRRVETVTMAEIQEAIIQSLLKSPNQSCTIKSLTPRVLKELGILTRGKPRSAFEKRVMRCVSKLEQRECLEKYKAKNDRVKLLDVDV
jgi:very-short-patch-repair endonuclease